MIFSAVVSLALANSVFAYTWPDHLTSELEHLLVDSAGYNAGGITLGVTPCSLYVQGPQTLGRQTSSQWMRVAFHDFATADVASGTGGIDASIGWETNRPENVGAAFNDSLSYWAQFVNKQASMADILALGTVLATASCAGPHLPYSGGRVDAGGPGPAGVPQPQQSVETQLAQMELAGFTLTEFIQLTACGHTIGATHYAGFPDIVNSSAITPNNTGGGIPFDNTKAVFDNNVVTEYLAGVAPDAMVTSFNATVRSDLRLFESDGNKTMRGLVSPETFSFVCTTLLTRMLNTVPKEVVLQPITPIPLKPVNVQLSISAGSELVLEGAIRLLSTSFPYNPERIVSISWKTASGLPGGIFPTTFSPNNTTGSSITAGPSPSLFNSTTPASVSTFYHTFSIPIDPIHGISQFTVLISEGGLQIGSEEHDNNGIGYRVQDNVMWVPELSSFSVDDDSGIATIVIIAAIKNGVTDPTVVFSVPTPQIGTQTPLLVTQNSTLVPVTSPLNYTSPEGYTLYLTTASIPSTKGSAAHSTFDVVGTFGGETFVDEFRKVGVIAGVPSWISGYPIAGGAGGESG